jgi:hypothetical protein
MINIPTSSTIMKASPITLGSQAAYAPPLIEAVVATIK